MGVTLAKVEDALEIDLSACRGSEFQDAKAKVRDIPGRRWNPEKKVWTVPADPQTAERVFHTLQPTADQELIDWMQEARVASAQELTTPLPKDAELLIPWATKRMPWQPEKVNDEEFNGLYDYQRAAVDLMARVHRAVLADDMGLGKTIQAISTVEEWKLRNDSRDGPKLVVCPASVKGSWARELNRWLEDPKVSIISGGTIKARNKQLQEAIAENGWIVTNWEQLRVKKERVKLKNGGVKTVRVMKEPLFEKTDWLIVVADEVHRAKNRKSQQTQGLWRTQGDLMLGLSGTPLMNSPDELWAILHWLFPKEYTSYWRFYEQYVDYYEGYFGKIITGVKNPDALRFELKERLIRRTAGAGGRKRIYVDVDMTPAQRKLYEAAERDMWLAVEQDIAAGDASAAAFARVAVEGGGTNAMYRIPNGAARMVRLLQILETPALLGAEDSSGTMDDFEQRFEDSRPEPWVVFCNYVDSCTILADRLRRKFGAEVAVYTGEVSPQERTEIEDRFQNGEIDVVIGTIKAMKEGITLTRSHLEYWLSRSFVPAENEQGESRLDRIGQQHKVMVYIAQPLNSVAKSKVAPINRLKERIVSTVIAKDKIEEVSQ